jgi:hypothetical protein
MSLGKIATYVEEAYRSFQEEVAGALDGQEKHLVQCGTADNSVKLNTAVGSANGVMFEKLQPGTGRKDDVTVRMLGKGGTVKVIQNAAIAYGARVMEDSTSTQRVKAVPGTTGTYRSIGIKLGQGGGAAGDVIEIQDILENIIVP